MKLFESILAPILISFILSLVILNNLPYSAISLKKNSLKKNIHSLLPQGWIFFTLNPRSEFTIVYNVGLEEIDLRNSSRKSIFGITKKNRIRNIELEVLLSQIDSNLYVDCRSLEEMQIAVDTIKAIDVKNKTNIRSFNGEYIIRKTTPMPWAWSISNRNLFMPSKIAKIKTHYDFPQKSGK